MPKYSNPNPGISRSEKNYRARIEHDGKHYEKRFQTIGEAKAWRSQLKSDLQRCPDGVEFKRGRWHGLVIHNLTEISKDFAELNDAVIWLERCRTQIRAGVYELSIQSHRNFETHFKEFLEQKKLTVSTSTFIRYESTWRNHLRDFFFDTEVRHIDRTMVQRWIQAEIRAGVSADAIRRAFILLREALFMAEDDGLIASNPAQRVALPAVERKTTRALTMIEVSSLAAECGTYEGMILFMSRYGLRDGEMRSLKVSDVDFENRTLIVDSTFKKVTSGSEIEGPTKTKRSRVLPLTDSALELLRPYCESKDSSSFLFSGASGGKLNYGWFRRTYLKPAAQRIGLGEVTMHTLRHTAASLQSRVSGDDVSVARLLGHARVSTTQNHYIHKSIEDLRRLVAQVEQEAS